MSKKILFRALLELLEPYDYVSNQELFKSFDNFSLLYEILRKDDEDLKDYAKRNNMNYEKLKEKIEKKKRELNNVRRTHFDFIASLLIEPKQNQQNRDTAISRYLKENPINKALFKVAVKITEEELLKVSLLENLELMREYREMQEDGKLGVAFQHAIDKGLITSNDRYILREVIEDLAPEMPPEDADDIQERNKRELDLARKEAERLREEGKITEADAMTARVQELKKFSIPHQRWSAAIESHIEARRTRTPNQLASRTSS